MALSTFRFFQGKGQRLSDVDEVRLDRTSIVDVEEEREDIDIQCLRGHADKLWHSVLLATTWLTAVCVSGVDLSEVDTWIAKASQNFSLLEHMIQQYDLEGKDLVPGIMTDVATELEAQFTSFQESVRFIKRGRND